MPSTLGVATTSDPFIVQAVAAAVVLGRLRSTKASVERTLCLVLRVVVETVLAVLGCLAALLVASVALAGLDASTAVVSRCREVAATCVYRTELWVNTQAVVKARLAHIALIATLLVTIATTACLIEATTAV